MRKDLTHAALDFAKSSDVRTRKRDGGGPNDGPDTFACALRGAAIERTLLARSGPSRHWISLGRVDEVTCHQRITTRCASTDCAFA